MDVYPNRLLIHAITKLLVSSWFLFVWNRQSWIWVFVHLQRVSDREFMIAKVKYVPTLTSLLMLHKSSHFIKWIWVVNNSEVHQCFILSRSTSKHFYIRKTLFVVIIWKWWKNDGMTWNTYAPSTHTFTFHWKYFFLPPNISRKSACQSGRFEKTIFENACVDENFKFKNIFSNSIMSLKWRAVVMMIKTLFQEGST